MKTEKLLFVLLLNSLPCACALLVLVRRVVLRCSIMFVVDYVTWCQI